MSGDDHNQADQTRGVVVGRDSHGRDVSVPRGSLNLPSAGRVWQVLPVNSCNVSLELNSQWRNGEHWHAVWPEDEGHWCYETQAEASERVAECQRLRGEVSS